MIILSEVKTALNITGNYQDATLQEYVNEVEDFLIGAGVKEKDITPALVARGVSDLWNYGSGEGKLSEYFMLRATQLSYQNQGGLTHD